MTLSSILTLVFDHPSSNLDFWMHFDSQFQIEMQLKTKLLRRFIKLRFQNGIPHENLRLNNGNQFQIDPVQPDAIVDTTAAGDGFNAGYISSRHAGNSPESSIIKASKQAAQIVAYAGAIVRGGYSS